MNTIFLLPTCPTPAGETVARFKYLISNQHTQNWIWQWLKSETVSVHPECSRNVFTRSIHHRFVTKKVQQCGDPLSSEHLTGYLTWWCNNVWKNMNQGSRLFLRFWSKGCDYKVSLTGSHCSVWDCIYKYIVERSYSIVECHAFPKCIMHSSDLRLIHNYTMKSHGLKHAGVSSVREHLKVSL